MALIKCKECGEEISDKATRCVHCNKTIEDCVHHFCPECKEEYDNTLCKNCGYKNATKYEKADLSVLWKILLDIILSGALTVLAINLFSISSREGYLFTFVIILMFCSICLFSSDSGFYSSSSASFYEDYMACNDDDPTKRAMYKQLRDLNDKLKK